MTNPDAQAVHTSEWLDVRSNVKARLTGEMDRKGLIMLGVVKEREAVT